MTDSIEFVDYGAQGEYGFFGKVVARSDVRGFTAEQVAAEIAAVKEIVGEHVRAIEVEQVAGLTTTRAAVGRPLWDAAGAAVRRGRRARSAAEADRRDEGRAGDGMTTSDVMNLRAGDRFRSPASGVTLTVCGGSFGNVEAEHAVAGLVPYVELRATADGRGMHRGHWHTVADGPLSEGTWAEVWTWTGCEFHGVVDAVSRKVVQVG